MSSDILLSGPIFVSQWRSEKYGMDLYVAGDYHHRDAKCDRNARATTTISRHIRDTVEYNTDKKIDLYIETTYVLPGSQEVNPSIDHPRTYIDEVVSTFGDCFQLDGTCAYKNLRPHYLDFRLVYDNPAVYVLDMATDANNSAVSRVKLTQTQRENQLLWLTATIENYETALTASSAYSESHSRLLNIIRLLYDRNDIIETARSHVPERLRVIIDEFMVKRMTEQYAEHIYGSFDPDTILDELKAARGCIEAREVVVSRVDELLRGFMFASNYALDMYLLYTLMGNRSNPIYAIVYIGALHARNLEEFLRWIGFDLIARAENKQQCVNLSEFHVPWFGDGF